MFDDVSAALKNCAACGITKATFNTPSATLTPLPILGLGFRWSIDLCGPFVSTVRGNQYVMVAIENFSKFVVFIPLPNKEAATTAFAFMQSILGQHGAPAEVLTDKGGEFEGPFDGTLQYYGIAHARTSPNHPSADGLAERQVQTLKAALRKMIFTTRTSNKWDAYLPRIALAFNCSKQASTLHVPYYIVYARMPLLPPEIRDLFGGHLPASPSADASAAEIERHAVHLARCLTERALAVEKASIMAWNNQHIAQYRDTLRYAKVRGGSYVPAIRVFRVGQFVYRRRQATASLQPDAHEAVLKVLQVKPSGILRLQGHCGMEIEDHENNCSPCFLTNLYTEVDVSLARPPVTYPCQVCKSSQKEEVMLLCDHCNHGYHTFCLSPPILTVPAGDWFCDICVRNGLTRPTDCAAPPIGIGSPVSNQTARKALKEVLAAQELLSHAVSLPVPQVPDLVASASAGPLSEKRIRGRPKRFADEQS